MTPRRKPLKATAAEIEAEEAQRMAACQAEGQRAKEKALLLVIKEVVATTPLSDETKQRITELMAGGDVHAT